jgi:hypothetical protein
MVIGPAMANETTRALEVVEDAPLNNTFSRKLAAYTDAESRRSTRLSVRDMITQLQVDSFNTSQTPFFHNFLGDGAMNFAFPPQAGLLETRSEPITTQQESTTEVCALVKIHLDNSQTDEDQCERLAKWLARGVGKWKVNALRTYRTKSWATAAEVSLGLYNVLAEDETVELILMFDRKVDHPGPSATTVPEAKGRSEKGRKGEKKKPGSGMFSEQVNF